MLFESDDLSQNIFRPSAPVIRHGVDKSWEESCDPGRLWLVAVHDHENIVEFWIAYLTRSQKLICAPRSSAGKLVAPTSSLLQSPAETQALQALMEITGLGTNWSLVGAQPPNEKSKGLALRVLEAIFLAGMGKPIVTVSAEGGVAIIYKHKETYAAIECLNRGSIWMLWFDPSGEPQSRRIHTGRKAIGEAIKQVDQIFRNV